jgi:pimeloyl-ACP methyl ester carboxylesterase
MITLRRMISLFVLLMLPMAVLAGSVENSYSIPEPDHVEPDSFRTWYVPISGVPSGAIITKVEAKFDYTAYGIVQNYVSVRFNRGSDPGSSGGALIVATGDLPPGNPGTFGWVTTHNWDGQLVNANYYFRFMLGGGSEYSCTIHGIYVRVTYDVPPPSLIQPSHLSIYNRLTAPPVEFKWTSVTGATQYHINVFPAGESWNPVIDAYTSSTPFTTSIAGWSNAIYVYQVQAFVGGAWTAWSTANHFIVDAPPDPPPLTAPANGADISIGSTTEFSWGDSPDNPIERYYFRLVSGTNLSAPPLYQIETAGHSVNVTFSDTTYDPGVHTWGVRAIKETPSGYSDTDYESTIGWGEYSLRTITLVALSSEPPNLVAPDDWAIFHRTSTPTVSFSWTAVSGALEYNLNIFPSGDAEHPVVNELVSETSQAIPISSWVNGVYVWHVRVRTAAGWSSYSPAREFIADTPPPAPALVAPGSGATFLLDGSTEFSWDTIADAHRFTFRTVEGNDIDSNQRVHEELPQAATYQTFDNSTYDLGGHLWGVRAIKTTPSGYDQEEYETTIGWGAYSIRPFTLSDGTEDLVMAEPLWVGPHRTTPDILYALPDEYGTGEPIDTECNLLVRCQLRNSGTSAYSIADYGVAILHDGEILFRITQGQEQTLPPGASTPMLSALGWLTDARLVGGSPTQLTAQAQYLEGGLWLDVMGSTAEMSFTLFPRPPLPDFVQVKRPRSADDPDNAEIFYHKAAIKWHLDDEFVANHLYPNWQTEFYVYPAAVVDALRDPVVPPHNATVPVLLGRNVLLKQVEVVTVYILEPNPGTSDPPLLRPFTSEEAFYLYGLPAGSMSTDVVTVEHDWAWVVSNYPIGMPISETVGNVSVSHGLTVTPDPVGLGQEFTVGFRLDEVAGESITFEKIAVYILLPDGSDLFNLQEWDDVTIGANESWSRYPSGHISDNPPGTYQAVARFKLPGGEWHDFTVMGEGANPIPFTVTSSQSWPTCDPACLVLRIEEDGGQGRVHSVGLRWVNPSPGGRGSKSQVSPREDVVEVVNGFAVFDSGLDWLNKSLELLDEDDNVIGHIGFEWEIGYSNDVMHAFLFLHDELGEGWPWNPGAPPADWLPIDSHWGYYQEGEYPVSMLIPPGCNIANVGQASEQPILFIHGVAGYFNYWDDVPEFVESTLSESHDAWRFCYPYDQPIQASAGLLGTALNKLRSGGLLGVPNYSAERVDIVAHSMGGLVARSWIQSEAYESSPNVNTLLMFATPNHGSHISYRLHEEHFPFEGIGEVFTTHDPEAPAHRQMIPAGRWIMDLNTESLRILGRGSLDKDYLVVAGTKDIIYAIPYLLIPFKHTEVANQDDGVVAVSSASMLRQGVPLALVDENHKEIHKAIDAAGVVVSFVLPEYDPQSPAFDYGGDAWVFEYHRPIEDSPLPRTEDYLDTVGILEFDMSWDQGNVLMYSVHAEGDHLILNRNQLGSNYSALQKCEGRRYFSRDVYVVSEADVDWDELDLEEVGIGFFAEMGEYSVQIYSYQLVWWEWPPRWRRALDGTCPEPIRFYPLCTTSEALSLPASSALASGAPNATSLEQIDVRSCEYGLFVDSAIDTIIFSLMSLDAQPDYYMHGMVLEDPNGQIIDPGTAQGDPQIVFYENLDHGPIQYIVEHPEEGNWIVRHEETILSPMVMAYTYGYLTSELAVSPSSCEAGDTIVCEVQLTGVGGYPDYEITLNRFITYPESLQPTFIGEIALDDLGGGAYSAELLEVVAGEHLFHLGLVCVTEVGDSIRLSDCENVQVTTDATPTQPDDDPDDDQAPEVFDTHFLGVWPNPFNPMITVKLVNSITQRVRISVYDIAGRRVDVLVDEALAPGEYQLDWDGRSEKGSDVSSGVYLICMEAKGISDSQKVVLLR